MSNLGAKNVILSEQTSMPRAKRYFETGLIWHITHRCHKKEFLLKFAKDRKRYMGWLFQAKKRYGIKVLNYIVTSNHIHLLVLYNRNSSHTNVIPLNPIGSWKNSPRI